VEYRKLCAEDISRELFAGFVRRQIVKGCWRRENGEWIVKDDPFIDDWSEEDYRELLAQLKELLLSGGFVYAAFSHGTLKGFVSVAPKRLGRRGEYLDLSHIYVSEDMRGKGIGKILFRAAAGWAGENGAEKLYISAHSAVESQAFYRAVGCVEAEEYDPEHVEKEPYDCQLEYVILR